jgi:hydrogenase maturation protease
MRTVVIGVGNATLRDDGVGVCAAREVARLMKGTTVQGASVTLGAGGLRLMEAMAGYDRAIVLDALTTGALAPGTTVELEIGDLIGSRNLACVHDMSLPVALEWGRAVGMPLPEEIRIFGVEAADVTTFSEDLSPEVAAAVPELVERVLGILTMAADGEAGVPRP